MLIFERWWLRPQTPVPTVDGGLAPRLPLASVGWGLRPWPPNTAPPIGNFWLRACKQNKILKLSDIYTYKVAIFLQRFCHNKLPITCLQSWAPATWKVAALPLFGKKSSGAAAYRYSNKKVAPLPLLKKIISKKNDGIQIRYLMMKFQLYLRKLIIQAFLRYRFRLQSALAGLNGRQVSKSPFN